MWYNLFVESGREIKYDIGFNCYRHFARGFVTNGFRAFILKKVHNLFTNKNTKTY
jgi:hypothetical protein